MPATDDQVQRHKEIHNQFQDAIFGRRDWSLATLRDYFTDDFVDHSAPGEQQGIEGVHDRLERRAASFTDAHEENLLVIGEADKLAVLYELRARHSGGYMGIAATNRSVVIPGIKILRFEDGRIAEHWSIYDHLSTAIEIGASINFEPRPKSDPYEEFARMSRPADRRGQQKILRSDGDPQVEANKRHLLDFQAQVFNKNDWSVPTLERFLTPDIIDHNTFPGDPPGLEGVRSRFSEWQMAFDDADEEYQAAVGESDLLAVQYDLHARHTGDYMGVPATGRAVTIPGIELLRFEDGLMAEHWGIYDFKSTAQQLGADLKLEVAAPPHAVHRWAMLGDQSRRN